MERQIDRETERQKDSEKYIKTERQKYKDSERQDLTKLSQNVIIIIPMTLSRNRTGVRER